MIVAGHVVVDPEQRDDYLSGCVEVVRQARRTAGCLDFALSADLIEPGRVNIFERGNLRPRSTHSAAAVPATSRVPRSLPPRSPSMSSATREASCERQSLAAIRMRGEGKRLLIQGIQRA